MRGRRDVRNTVFVPNPEPNETSNGIPGGLSPSSLPSAGASLVAVGPTSPSVASPIKRPGVIPEDRASDANSIHSSHTLSSIGGHFAHPDLHEPGLNASVVETVSTWFTDGAVSKSFAVGEIALAYNPIGSGETQSNETIRLDNFQVLEKVAANPSFVTSNASDKGKGPAGSSEEEAGEYSLNLAAITKSTPTIGFKYQLHLEPEHPSIYSPILLTPAWQIQDTQTSVIIAYSLNPVFDFSSSTPLSSLTLRNFALTVSLDLSGGESVKATSALMAPQTGATFKRKQSAVVWKLPELNVTSEPQRLLARFITTGGPARQGHIEAKWELQGRTGSGLGISVLIGQSQDASTTDTDPFADEDGSGAAAITPTTTAGGTGSTQESSKVWTPIPVNRKLVTGRYAA